MTFRQRPAKSGKWLFFQHFFDENRR